MLPGARGRPPHRAEGDAPPMPVDSPPPPPPPAAAPRDRAAAGRPAAPAPLADSALARRKRRDAAAILPLAGILLFASPLLDVVAGGGRLAGIPLAVVFVFGAWFGLIALTARLAATLSRDGTGDEAP
jgi:hypothetical protein